LSGIRRRELLTSAGVGFAAANLSSAPARAQQTTRKSLDISDYEPKSMLRVKETRVERSRFPVIDRCPRSVFIPALLRNCLR
jgi:hypothetical protein